MLAFHHQRHEQRETKWAEDNWGWSRGSPGQGHFCSNWVHKHCSSQVGHRRDHNLRIWTEYCLQQEITHEPLLKCCWWKWSICNMIISKGIIILNHFVHTRRTRWRRCCGWWAHCWRWSRRTCWSWGTRCCRASWAGRRHWGWEAQVASLGASFPAFPFRRTLLASAAFFRAERRAASLILTRCSNRWSIIRDGVPDTESVLQSVWIRSVYIAF